MNEATNDGSTATYLLLLVIGLFQLVVGKKCDMVVKVSLHTRMGYAVLCRQW